MKQLGLPPIGLKSPPVFFRLFAFFYRPNPDTPAIQRNGASSAGNILRGKNRFGLLRIARFIGEMIGERPQRLYINGATALLKNENRFFQGTQCRG
jgi:hypothetical protein